jgi:beta-1,4-mannosyl-glycoprotein beta-1,4-N-acetylglucosaminyltransferase
MRDEIDILNIRLQELSDHVDIFVIVEANKTFAGQDKSFYAETVISQYSKEIRYVKVVDLPEMINNDRWPLEYYQRNAIMRGLEDMRDDDVVMISDVDEIWDPGVFERIPYCLEQIPYCFEQMPINIYLNLMKSKPSRWFGTLALFGKHLRHETPQQWRLKKDVFKKEGIGGWHFSWIGDSVELQNKMQSCCHVECDNEQFLITLMNQRRDLLNMEIVDINKLPKSIQNNIEYFKQKGLICG